MALSKSRKKKTTTPSTAPLGLSHLPKISATLLEFAKPLLETVPEPFQIEYVRAAMILAVIAWNLPMLERIGRADGVRHSFEQQSASLPEGVRALVDTMMVSRIARWTHDLRVVSDMKVQIEGDQLHITAEAGIFREGSDQVTSGAK